GKLLPPKLGLLSIVVDAVLGAEGDAGRKVFFVPISIGYERLVEERSYVHELSGGEKTKEDVSGLLRAAESALGRYGRLNVQFGELLTLDGVLQEIGSDSNTLERLTPAKRRALVTRLAYRVMNEINRVTAVTPSALVAAALLTHGKRGLPHTELVARCERIAAVLHGKGARFAPSLIASSDPFALRHEAIREALELLFRAGHVEAHRPGVPAQGKKRGGQPGHDAVYVVPDLERISLDIAKNLVVHFFVTRAMIATPLAATGETPIDPALLAERALALSRLFKYEFMFRADAPFDAIFAETLDAMERDGQVVRDGAGNVRLAPEGEPRERALLHVAMVRSFVEGYRATARALAALLRGPLAPKDLVKRALTTGERMFLAGEIASREAVSRPVIENALLAFADQGYVDRDDGKYVLPESYASPDAVRTIEARIASYL
ncbi:MAG TPA: hypothetical protein VIF62_12465, partial [Labilithrix sp.]